MGITKEIMKRAKEVAKTLEGKEPLSYTFPLVALRGDKYHIAVVVCWMCKDAVYVVRCIYFDMDSGMETAFELIPNVVLSDLNVFTSENMPLNYHKRCEELMDKIIQEKLFYEKDYKVYFNYMTSCLPPILRRGADIITVPLHYDCGMPAISKKTMLPHKLGADKKRSIAMFLKEEVSLYILLSGEHAVLEKDGVWSKPLVLKEGDKSYAYIFHTYACAKKASIEFGANGSKTLIASFGRYNYYMGHLVNLTNIVRHMLLSKVDFIRFGVLGERIGYAAFQPYELLKLIEEDPTDMSEIAIECHGRVGGDRKWMREYIPPVDNLLCAKELEEEKGLDAEEDLQIDSFSSLYVISSFHTDLPLFEDECIYTYTSMEYAHTALARFQSHKHLGITSLYSNAFKPTFNFLHSRFGICKIAINQGFKNSRFLQKEDGYMQNEKQPYAGLLMQMALYCQNGSMQSADVVKSILKTKLYFPVDANKVLIPSYSEDGKPICQCFTDFGEAATCGYEEGSLLYTSHLWELPKCEHIIINPASRIGFSMDMGHLSALSQISYALNKEYAMNFYGHMEVAGEAADVLYNKKFKRIHAVKICGHTAESLCMEQHIPATEAYLRLIHMLNG